MRIQKAWAAVFFGLFSLAPLAQGFEIQLRLSSGIGRLNPSEVNTAVVGWAEEFKLRAGFYPTWNFVDQHVRALKQCVSFEGELLFSLSRRFALGLSAGYSYGAVQDKDAILTIISDGVVNNWTKPSKVSAYPVIASGYVFFPVGPKLSVYLRAGAGQLYARFVGREGLKEISATSYSYPVVETASARKPSYVGGIGLNYRFDSSFGFFVEASGLSGRVDNFAGQDTQKQPGRLYFYEEYFSYLDYWQSKMRVLAAAPSGPNFRSVGEASVDFSGYSFKIGLLLKF
jgi:hypothetical protein